MTYDPRHKSAGKKCLRCNALTGSIDFALTILELAGVKAPENLDGKSLLPLLDDNTTSIREKLLVMNVWGSTQTQLPFRPHPSLEIQLLVVRRKAWNLREELYHLDKDFLELTNLAQANGKDLEKHRQLYDQAIAHWKQNAPERYQHFGTRFDRNLPPEKKPINKPPRRK